MTTCHFPSHVRCLFAASPQNISFFSMTTTGQKRKRVQEDDDVAIGVQQPSRRHMTTLDHTS